MNTRDNKQFFENNYYHIINRGVAKMEIFKDEFDKKLFLYRLNESLFPERMTINKFSHTGYTRTQLASNSFTLLAYCLMPNHFHFLIRQNNSVPISKLMSKVCGSYGKYFNLKYERVGSVFQDQNKAILVEHDSQLLWLSAYIHNNPKTAGLVKNLSDYPWSSYLDYTQPNRDSIVNTSLILGMTNSNSQNYQKFVTQAFLKTKEIKKLGNLLLD